MMYLFSLLAESIFESAQPGPGTAPAKPGNLGGTLKGLGVYSTEDLSSIDNISTNLEMFLSNIIGFLTIAAGISFLIYFSIGGLTWITAGGDTGKVEEAKSRMTNGAIGMIIIVASWSIVWIIGEVLGLNILNLKETLPLITPKAG